MPTKRLCLVEVCGKPQKSRGLCTKHYKRFMRNGSVIRFKNARSDSLCEADGCNEIQVKKGLCERHYHSASQPINFQPKDADFLSFLEQTLKYSSPECLIWPFRRNSKGYAVKGLKLVHRIVCKAAHGEPPTPKHHAAHWCGKGHLACIAPNHLRWATAKENAADKIIHGTNQKGRPQKSKVSDGDARIIRSMRGWVTLATLAKRFGISASTARQIQISDRWKHVS